MKKSLAIWPSDVCGTLSSCQAEEGNKEGLGQNEKTMPFGDRSKDDPDQPF